MEQSTTTQPISGSPSDDEVFQTNPLGGKFHEKPQPRNLRHVQIVNRADFKVNPQWKPIVKQPETNN